MCELVNCFWLAEGGVSAEGIAKWAGENPWPIIVLAVALLFAACVFTDPKRKMSGSSNVTASAPGDGSDARLRNTVAMTVLIGSIFGIVFLGALVIFGISPNSPNIFNAVLPVFVTWVGTLLAYYFGKDNYESGAQHSADLARDLTGAEKLRKIPVTSVMIPFDKIEIPQEVKDKPESEYVNVSLLSVTNVMHRERLPLFLPVVGFPDSVTGGFKLKSMGTRW